MKCRSNSSLDVDSCLSSLILFETDTGEVCLALAFFYIEKAIQKMLLHDNIRYYTRFLWLFNPAYPSSPQEVYRSKVVLMGAKPLPFIFNAVLHHQLAKFSSAEAAVILRNMNVDNFVSGRNTREEAAKFFIVFHRGGTVVVVFDGFDIFLNSKLFRNKRHINFFLNIVAWPSKNIKTVEGGGSIGVKTD